jgi:hypothetical protein
MSDEPKKRSRAWTWAAIALLLIAGATFCVFLYTASEGGSEYFDNAGSPTK